jgi:acetyl-CoA acyltransferase
VGETAEESGESEYDISRKRQEEFAVLSQQKAAAAQQACKLSQELVPITGKGVEVTKDGCLRPDTSLEGLAELKLAFDQNGTVTAGTSSPLTDGAAAALVCSEEYAAKAACGRSSASRRSPSRLPARGDGARPGCRRRGARAGRFRARESTSSSSTRRSPCSRSPVTAGLDGAKVNLDGGAIALGHPLAPLARGSPARRRRCWREYALASMHRRWPGSPTS